MAGLLEWVNGDLKKWLAKLRKEGSRAGTQANVTMFVNAWSYECKAAFYTCYANVWVCLLEKSEAHSGLEEVRRVRVPERVHRNALLEGEPGDHPAQGPLQALGVHRSRGGRALVAGVAEEGEEPHGIAVRLPVGAQAPERRVREGDVAVARPLASATPGSLR